MSIDEFNRLHQRVWGCNPVIIRDNSDIRNYKVTIRLGDDHEVSAMRTFKDAAIGAAVKAAAEYIRTKYPS